MTDVPTRSRGAGTPASRQPAPIGKVGDKRFTAQPESGHRTAALAGAQAKSVLGGVRRLLRTAMHGSLPRAGNPLRHARLNLDAAYECLLKTLLGGAEPHGPRMAFALAETLATEAAYVAAGGRLAMPNCAYPKATAASRTLSNSGVEYGSGSGWGPGYESETGSASVAAPGRHADPPNMPYAPPLAPYAFTELLLLREYLPRVAMSGPDRIAPGPCGRLTIERSCGAVDREISLREQPFTAVLQVLAQEGISPEDLEGPLRTLAMAVSMRERRGESPIRFLSDLADSRNNAELENAAAALASAPLRVSFDTASIPGTQGRLTLSAYDGGVKTCARVLKNALDQCMRSRLIIRARLILRQGAEKNRATSDTLRSVFDMLSQGVASMNGDAPWTRSQRDAQVTTLLAKALVGADGLDVQRYVAGMSDATLRVFERHLPFLPAPRRKAVLQIIEHERRRRGDGDAGARSGERSSGRLFSRTMGRVGMQATPILARLFARVQLDLRRQAATDNPAADREPAPSSDALTRMSFDVTARNNGDYEVSVTANLTPHRGDDPVSVIYKSRIAPDFKPLHGSFRQTR
ncbi:hypothetical protein [Bordetella genomosp. 9]|uniref:hypothetical protein n=1 Tax=Bordetella genomosp. 9 TaxID=1416803 RepID=UPI001177C132|nr:hypothetical protein [Bordetella genomosp. 9]